VKQALLALPMHLRPHVLNFRHGNQASTLAPGGDFGFWHMTSVARVQRYVRSWR